MEDWGCETGGAPDELDGPDGVVDEDVAGGAELPGGVTGFGAETPAISEPRPSFCSVGASSFPLESIP